MDWHRIIFVFLGVLLTQCSDHLVRCVITDVRLVGGPTSNKGTVEIGRDNGPWETTCGIDLGISDVTVICRYLGFAGASRAITDTPYAQNSDYNRGLLCNGDEAALSGCKLIQYQCPFKAGAASCYGEDYLGCFVDKSDDRLLSGDRLYGHPSMSISYCIQFCKESTAANYKYAGVEYGDQCYCGETSDDYTRHGVGTDAHCQVPCTGDPTESCGGFQYIAIFTIHVETVETTPAVVSSEKVTHVSTEKVTEVTSQPGSEPISHTKDAVTSSSMATPLSTPTTLQQSGHGSCVGVGVGEGVVIILLIATIIVLVIYIFRIRKNFDPNHGHITDDMTLAQASSSHDKDTGFYHDIRDIRTPVSTSTPAGGSHYSLKIYDQTRGHAIDPADTGIPTESTHYSTRIEKN
ncbi:uncharacterized protein LOC105444780 [Strongylocentrotus purpuratus]|uniref:Uncharacterized protein n=1 Tax=Strongylocentrotus purpuratus TaxID=7668 RepID=A0A7M7NN03_STRPU|nr:uncharacterized protein LOC105444780 [Strongylocentrotus purpuratus]XP_030838978.1 uncharacterized protein LOC105444780 [Strongylocentrotus purpuratus]